jgi:hypothetical protein
VNAKAQSAVPAVVQTLSNVQMPVENSKVKLEVKIEEHKAE